MADGPYNGYTESAICAGAAPMMYRPPRSVRALDWLRAARKDPDTSVSWDFLNVSCDKRQAHSQSQPTMANAALGTDSSVAAANAQAASISGAEVSC